ncbi:PREDICTED: up-regulator of cell proliferation [Elephantulus edwardii]|uniref:up-regulator of cell proliferation n=1 Tax=Elephantulus edwardii TaxID=28737 RepID=UPI0003F06895|nr:PREDICTED: up-regulator of cell proliferation [Elephantulus edwardii]
MASPGPGLTDLGADVVGSCGPESVGVGGRAGQGARTPVVDDSEAEAGQSRATSLMGHPDLGEVTPEIKPSERGTALAIADLEWREMEGDDCEFHYGDGSNEVQDNEFPTVERSRLQEMLSLLGLEMYQIQKLSLQDSLQISSDSMKNWAPQVPKDLPWNFLRKLQALNAEARNTTMVLDALQDVRLEEKEGQMEEEVLYWGSTDEAAADIYSFSELPTPDTPVNPLDLLCALLLSSDSFLQQDIILKMFLCQFALPLVLPDSENHYHMFLLWALRGLVRTWWSQPLRSPGSFREDSVILSRMPTFAFVRMDVSSNSKSQLLNAILSPSHKPQDCFWHRDLNLGASSREIADGLVEISWFFPSGREDLDIFPEPVAFINLRGDIGSHWLQFKLLTDISSAVFILTDNISKKEYKLLFSMKESNTKYYFILSPYRGKRNTNLRFLNKLIPVLKIDYSHVLVKVSSTDSESFVRKLQSIVRCVMRSPCRRVSVEDMANAARKLGLRVDEDCEECQKAKERMEKITRKIRDPEAYKQEELRLQGEPWRKVAQVEKELCRLQWAGDPSEKCWSELRGRLLELRGQQNSLDPTWGLQEFVRGISSPSPCEKQYFLRWMEFGLARLAQQRLRPPPETLFSLRAKYYGTLDATEPLWPDPLGVEHFLREMGQFYEAESCLVEAGKLPACQRRFAHFPGLALELLLRGLPLELVDGGSLSVPLRWVTGLLRELHTRLERRSRLVVLSALGVPGTGKSTLLNTMFGLRFATGKGSSHRGAFMQLVEVAEGFSQDLGCDHILVIDSGGWIGGALTTAGERFELEASLATLIMGLSNVTVVSLAETRHVPLALLHAFLRLETTGHTPSYQFVYQNVHGTSVPSTQLRDGRQYLESLSDGGLTVACGEMQGDSVRALANVAFGDLEKQHIWHIPGLWHGVPPMAPVSLGYSEAIFELKRCLLENIRNGLSSQNKNIQQLIELVRQL